MSQSRTEGKVIVTLELPEIVWRALQQQATSRGFRGGPYLRSIAIDRLNTDDPEFAKTWRNTVTGKDL